MRVLVSSSITINTIILGSPTTFIHIIFKQSVVVHPNGGVHCRESKGVPGSGVKEFYANVVRDGRGQGDVEALIHKECRKERRFEVVIEEAKYVKSVSLEFR